MTRRSRSVSQRSSGKAFVPTKHAQVVLSGADRCPDLQMLPDMQKGWRVAHSTGAHDFTLQAPNAQLAWPTALPAVAGTA